MTQPRIVIAIALLCAACLPDALEGLPPEIISGDGGSGGGDTIIEQSLDKERAQLTFPTTTELMRYTISPTCAAENNECHNNEDFPDLSTEGNLWNLLDLRCNLGVGERETVEDYCEAQPDMLAVGASRFAIGSVSVVNDDEESFDYYEIRIDQALSESLIDADFTIERDGSAMPQLGSGNSLEGDSGSDIIRIQDADDIPDVLLISQGDENRNGVFGDGSGTIIKPGDARGSYMIRRLMLQETERVQMPLNENADNPTEVNRTLSPDELYVLTSWINCIEPGDNVYAPIRYDCAANADNEGTW